MDSIRENRTKEDLITELQLELSGDLENEKCFIIVEGSDDVSFVKNIVCSNVICLESFCGKEGIQEIIQEPAFQVKNIIAIRDRDYMDTEILSDRMFLYDHCCLEMMLLANEMVADSFYKNFYRGKYQREKYIVNIMRQLAAYSVLRRKNEKEVLKIKFKAGFADLIDEQNESLDMEKLFERIGQKNKYNCCQEEADFIDDAILWDITNGHDICTYLGILSKLNKNKLSEGGVRNILFAIFRKEDFKLTDLYRQIAVYQLKNDLCIVS